MSRFEGKTVVVTGAGSGMGREVAIALAAEGATVIALDVSCPEPFTNPAITYRQHDVQSEEAWEALKAELSSANGGVVDILVNAAGVVDYEPLVDIKLSTWRKTIGVDLDGVMLGMRAMIPLMRSKGGSICNFASIWGLVGVPGIAAYHAAKGAVIQLTRNAAITYGAENIRVNCICPGVIATPMVLNQDKEFNDTLIARTPLGRMGTPQEIAKAVLFMVSDDCTFMTGHTMVMDGGWTAQ